MSTLSVSNITDGVDTVETGYAINGSAKAWANLNGSGTPAFRDSLNISGVVDNGTGDYTPSFTSNMGSSNYTMTTAGTASYALWAVGTGTSGVAAGSIRVRSYTSNVTLTDSEMIWFAIHGDLA